MSTKNHLCQVCDKQFNTRYSFSRHLANVHKIAPPSANATRRLVCPKCPERFYKHEPFVRHLKEIHSLDLPVEEYSFPSEDEFLNWRYNLQEKSLVEYTKESATKTLSDGSKKMYLTCHQLYRPNHPLKKPEDRKRALKSQGSKKTSGSCPSRIEVVYNKDLTLCVKYWTTHFGHLNDLRHCSLDKFTKDKIATKLKSGVTFDEVLNTIRRPDNENTSWSKRTCILKKKDLHNIVRQYKLSYPKEQQQDDGLSVKIMSEFQKEEHLQFSSSNICIDGTDGTNDYEYEILVHTTKSEEPSESIKERLKEKLKLALDLLERKSENVTSQKSRTIEKSLDVILKHLNKIPDETCRIIVL